MSLELHNERLRYRGFCSGLYLFLRHLRLLITFYFLFSSLSIQIPYSLVFSCNRKHWSFSIQTTFFLYPEFTNKALYYFTNNSKIRWSKTPLNNISLSETLSSNTDRYPWWFYIHYPWKEEDLTNRQGTRGTYLRKTQFRIEYRPPFKRWKVTRRSTSSSPVVSRRPGSSPTCHSFCLAPEELHLSGLTRFSGRHTSDEWTRWIVHVLNASFSL